MKNKVDQCRCMADLISRSELDVALMEIIAWKDWHACWGRSVRNVGPTGFHRSVHFFALVQLLRTCGTKNTARWGGGVRNCPVKPLFPFRTPNLGQFQRIRPLPTSRSEFGWPNFAGHVYHDYNWPRLKPGGLLSVFRNAAVNSW